MPIALAGRLQNAPLLSWRLSGRATGFGPEQAIAIVAACAWLSMAVMWLVHLAPTGGAHGDTASMTPGLRPAALAEWEVMVLAMMLPSVVAEARAIRLKSLWRRRYRAVGCFCGGYLAVWLLVGAALLRLGQSVDAQPVAAMMTFVLVAAAWHCLPPRRKLMRRCGRVSAISLTGIRADVDCCSAGLRAGSLSVATCGPLMAVMSGSASVPLAAGLSCIAFAEFRRGPNPDGRVGTPAQAACLVVLAGVIGLTGSWPPLAAAL